MRITARKAQFFFLILYLFFLSFFNYTPFYLAAAMGMMLFTVIRVAQERKIRFTSYVLFETIFILYSILYVFLGWSINNEHTMDAVKTLILNLAITVCVINTVNDENDINRVLRWLIPISVFACVFAAVFIGSGDGGRLAQGAQRLFGSTLYTSMEFSSWAVYAGAISIYVYFETKKKRYLLLCVLFWLIILWCGSRKWIAFGAVLQMLIYLFCGRQVDFKVAFRRVFLISVVLIGIYLLVMYNSTLYNIAGKRFLGYLDGTESSAGSRAYFMNTAMKYIGQNPVWGYGLNTFRDVNVFGNWSEINYLEITFAGGIPLAIFYYGYMAFLLKGLFGLRKINKIYYLLFFVILTIICSDIMSMSYLQRTEQFFFALASFSLAYEKRKRRARNENRKSASHDVYVQRGKVFETTN